MKLQQLSAVLACFLLFLLTISPEFTEAGITSFRKGPWSRIGRKIPGFGSTTPAAIKKAEEKMEKMAKIQDAIDWWNDHAPGHVSPACRHLTNIGPSKSVTVCSLSKCTESCNVNNSYNCGVCYTTSMCVCYN